MNSELVTLNHYLAQSGVCSRRQAVEYIRQGRVSINHSAIKAPGHRVNPTDVVRFDGKVLTAEQPVYVAMNKPLGVITSRADEEGRITVIDVLAQSMPNAPRLFPVGRLDYDSQGLLILTNDGALAQSLMHPKFGVSKRYRVRLDRPVSSEFITALHEGVLLNDGIIRVERLVPRSRAFRTFDVWLKSGRNRIIRRMFAAGGYHVIELERIGIAGISDPRLRPGVWRRLRKAEIELLRSSAERGAH